MRKFSYSPPANLRHTKSVPINLSCTNTGTLL
nr:MAG TPA: hypothetical protein [Caudoviricetes sp.]